jgi:hypothetical protein
MSIQSRTETVELMARVLRCREVDLGDEREVLRVLQAARFPAVDIVMLSDKATDEARRQSAEFGAPQ